MKKLLVLSVLLLAGCANSGAHEVVTAEKPSDEYLSCKEIRIEKKRMQYIIDEVNKDKGDMTGADVVDGLLWFPFNVMVKQGNYSDALKGADARLDHLTVLEHENGCTKKKKS